MTDVFTGASGSRTSKTSFAGGGQIGCDYQLQFVGGRRSQHVRRRRHSPAAEHLPTRTVFTGAGSIDTKLKLVRCFDGRAGYLRGTELVDLRAGRRRVDESEATAFNGFGAQVGSISGNSRTGWTAGGGVEWMFVPHWSRSLNTITWALARSSSFAVCPVGATCDIFQRQSECPGCPGGRELQVLAP